MEPTALTHLLLSFFLQDKNCSSFPSYKNRASPQMLAFDRCANNARDNGEDIVVVRRGSANKSKMNSMIVMKAACLIGGVIFLTLILNW